MHRKNEEKERVIMDDEIRKVCIVEIIILSYIATILTIIAIKGGL